MLLDIFMRVKFAEKEFEAVPLSTVRLIVYGFVEEGLRIKVRTKLKFVPVQAVEGVNLSTPGKLTGATVVEEYTNRVEVE